MISFLDLPQTIYSISVCEGNVSLENSTFQCSVPPLCPVLWNLTPVHAFILYSCEIKFNVIFLCKHVSSENLSKSEIFCDNSLYVTLCWQVVCSVFVLSCVGSGLATGWSLVQGVLPTDLGLRNWSETKRFSDALCSKGGATGERDMKYLNFEVLTMVKLHVLTFWVISPFNKFGDYQRFGGT
jgi:hypothetical protein